MRILLLGASALTLSACSSYDLFAPEYGDQNVQQNYGHYQSANYQSSHYQVNTCGGCLNIAPTVDQLVGQNNNQPFAAATMSTSTYVYPVGEAGHHGDYHSTQAPQTSVNYPALRGSGHGGDHQPRYYTNIGGIMYDVSDEAFGIIGRAGVQNGMLGAELEGSFGVIDETERFDGLDINGDPAELKASAGARWSTGAFVTARMPIVSNLDAFGRVGYHITEYEGKVSVDGERLARTRNHSDGIAYGGGLEYNVDAMRAIRVDYTRYESDDFITSDSVSASFVSRF